MKTSEQRGRYVTLKGGLRLAYEDYGTGPVPIVFIHGFPFDKLSWKPQMEFLKSSYRTIAYDQRGFGGSGQNGENVTIDVFANDLIGLLDSLGISKAMVCGLSMGGYVLLNAISRFPDRFAAMVLCDTQCIADSAVAREKRMRTIALIEGGGLEVFADTFIANIFCKETIDTKPSIVEGIRSTILATSEETITRTLMALANRRETSAVLKDISVPALVLCGKEDVVTPPEQSEFLYRNIPNAKLHVLENAGHMANIEQAETFNRHLLQFVASLIDSVD